MVIEFSLKQLRNVGTEEEALIEETAMAIETVIEIDHQDHKGSIGIV